MSELDIAAFGSTARIASAYAPPFLRPALLSALALDDRMGEIPARTSEPTLAQLRYAWWRDRLGELERGRRSGEELLERLAESWHAHRAALVALVDGWENAVDGPPFDAAKAVAFVEGRAEIFAALADIAGSRSAPGAARAHGVRYFRGDLVARYGAALEDEAYSALQLQAISSPPLPRRLRALTVLSGLGERTFRRRHGPLLGDRGSPFVAMRLGIFGR